MEINKLIGSLKYCSKLQSVDDCTGCPKFGDKICASTYCVDDLLMKAANALEAQQQRIDEMKAERDALIEVLHSRCGCDSCKYKALDALIEPCNSCKGTGGMQDNWEWCGLEKEV